MSLNYGLFQPLRFYENVNHQNRFKRLCSENVFTLVMPVGRILPFQIKRPASSLPLSAINYVNVDTGMTFSILDSFAPGELELFSFDTYDIFVNYGTEDLTFDIPAGNYYLQVEDGALTWYSEVFKARVFDSENLANNDCVYTKVEYYDTCDIAGIFYRTSAYSTGLDKVYKSWFFLDIEIGKPEYEYTEEGDEDGEGTFRADYKRMSKQHLLQPVLPEYMVDAVQLVPLHKYIKVTSDKGYTGDVDTFTVDSRWEGNNGCWATTDMLFTTEFITKTNCCDAQDLPITGCLRTSNTVIATIVEDSADYLAFQYTQANDGVTTVPLVDGDLVLIEDLAGILTVRMYNQTGSSYDIPVTIYTPGDSIKDLNTAELIAGPPIYYYFGADNLEGWLTTPVLTTFGYDQLVNKYRASGTSFDAGSVQIEIDTTLGASIVAQGTAAQFRTGGLTFPVPNTATRIRVLSVGASGCIAATSDWLDLVAEGISVAEIGLTFIVQ